MSTDSLKGAFWAVVTDCLVEFHQKQPLQARILASELRERIESPPPGIDAELFYHSEPFDVACEIAGQAMEIREHWPRYEAILRQRFAAAEAAIRSEPVSPYLHVQQGGLRR